MGENARQGSARVMGGCCAPESGSKRVDMYTLAIDSTDTQQNAPVYTSVWPLDREAFEDALRRGTVQSWHSPETLPDNPFATTASEGKWRRHRLGYRWNHSMPILGVISCNPSRATRRQLDDTLALTINQAAIWGFGGIDQGNLDPVFETNSQRMHITADLNDAANQVALESILENGTVWLAWGNKPRGLKKDLQIAWRRAEQHVLASAFKRQILGIRLVVTRLNKGEPHRAPRHASPRRFPPTAPPTLFKHPLAVRVLQTD